MKKLLAALVLLTLASGCGYEAVDNSLTGQVKKVVHRTPLICPDYVEVDISLGVMRNGVGSMSTEDVWVTVPASDVMAVLTTAQASGQLVTITYDVKRVVFCIDDHIAKSAKLEK